MWYLASVRQYSVARCLQYGIRVRVLPGGRDVARGGARAPPIGFPYYSVIQLHYSIIQLRTLRAKYSSPHPSYRPVTLTLTHC